MKNAYTVSEVTRYIRNMFSQDFVLKSVKVSGEVSNCKYHSSGHIYFTLKDESSSIACVMFASNREGLTFTLSDGMKIEAEGRVDVYERSGSYQLYAFRIVQAGAGDLYLKYEALKKELGIDEIDFSKIFYIQTNMDLEHPDDAVRGKLTFVFEKIKKCEPTNPNALYRLIVDTVSDKACYEYSIGDYEEIKRLKGLSRNQFDELLDLHAEKSKTGFQAAAEYIENLPDVKERMIYKRSLPNVLKLLSTSWNIKEIEKEISRYLLGHDVGDTDNAIDLLISKFNDRFPVEVSRVDRVILYIVILKRYEDGVYGYEDDI